MASVYPTTQDQQTNVFARREWKGLTAGRLSTEVEGLIMISSSAAVERTVNGGGPLLDVLFGDNRGTSPCLLSTVSSAAPISHQRTGGIAVRIARIAFPTNVGHDAGCGSNIWLISRDLAV